MTTKDIQRKIDDLDRSNATMHIVSVLNDLNSKIAEIEPNGPELMQLKQELKKLQEAACDFIGPDEDNKPECTCCGMSLEAFSKGHKSDCLANLILQIKL